MCANYDIYLNALIKGDKATCRSIVVELREKEVQIMDIYENYFRKSLYQIGKLWENNEISVAVEHMSTAITEGIMNEFFSELISIDRKNKKAVISCVEDEEHQVGGKMVADIFEKNGWDAFYLGANTPASELIKFCEIVKPDIIALSLSVYFNLTCLMDEIKRIRESFDVPIFIGGQAIRNNGIEIANKFKNVHFFNDIYSVENYIKGEM